MKKIKIEGAAFDAILLAIIRLMTTLLGIVSTMLLSKSLSLLAYGTYSQANLVISMGTSFSIMGFADGTSYFFNKAQNDEESQENIGTIFALQMIIGIFLGIGILIFQNLIIAYFDNTELAGLFIYIAFRPLLNNLLSMLQNLQISIGKAKTIAVRNIIVAVVKLLAIYLAINVFNNIQTIFLILLILDFCTVVYFWISFAADKYNINIFKFKKQILPQIMRFCIPMGVYVLTNSLSRDIDKFCIGKLGGTEQLAIYTNCSAILPVDIISAAFLTVVIPIMTRYVTANDFENGKQLFSKYIKISCLTTVTFSVALMMLSEEVILFLYGDKYLVGKSVFLLYMIVNILRFANLSLVVSANGETSLLMKLSIFTLILNIILNIVFYMLVGFTGPAIATVAITLLSVIWLMRRSMKILHMIWKEIFTIKELILFIVELIISGIIFRYLASFMTGNGISPMITIFVAGGGMCGLVFLVNLKKLCVLFREINKLK